MKGRRGSASKGAGCKLPWHAPVVTEYPASFFSVLFPPDINKILKPLGTVSDDVDRNEFQINLEGVVSLYQDVLAVRHTRAKRIADAEKAIDLARRLRRNPHVRADYDLCVELDRFLRPGALGAANTQFRRFLGVSKGVSAFDWLIANLFRIFRNHFKIDRKYYKDDYDKNRIRLRAHSSTVLKLFCKNLRYRQPSGQPYLTRSDCGRPYKGFATSPPKTREIGFTSGGYRVSPFSSIADPPPLLVAALEDHGMLPTRTEITGRRLAFSVAEAAVLTSICRSKLYDAIARGDLEAHKDGKETIVIALQFKNTWKACAAHAEPPAGARGQRHPARPCSAPGSSPQDIGSLTPIPPASPRAERARLAVKRERPRACEVAGPPST